MLKRILFIGLGGAGQRHLRLFKENLKDKNSDNANVLLGTGLVNFESVFFALNDIDYSGPYTFETTRGSNPINTAKYNMNLVNFFKDNSENA